MKEAALAEMTPRAGDSPPRTSHSDSMSRSFGRARLVFIRAGTIEARHGNSDEPEVNRELRAMMDEMVEAHSANAGDTRHGEDLLATGQQFPTFRHVAVTHFGECSACFGGPFIKGSKEFLAVGDFWRLKGGAANGGVIELLRIDGHGDPLRNSPDVGGEPAESAGFFVRLPVPLFIGTAFQDSARVFHLLVEFGQHGMSNSHGNLLCEIREFSAAILGE